MTHDDTIWLAAYLEGEGTFNLYIQSGRKRPQVRVAVSSSDLDVLERAARIMASNVYGPYTPSQTHSLGKKSRWVAQVHGQRAQALMAELLPHMGQRRSARIRECLAVQVAEFPNLARDPATGRTVIV